LYNEEESLQKLFEWISKVMDANKFSYEVIFVNDGSTDKSWQVIETLSATSDAVRAIKFRNNYGKTITIVMNGSEDRVSYKLIVGNSESILEIEPRAIQTILY
jgi:glycosyltransferase involved in cell wall biosynthesis